MEAKEPPRYVRAFPAPVSRDCLDRWRRGASCYGGAAYPTDGAPGTMGRIGRRINLGRMQLPVTSTVCVWSRSAASVGESKYHGEEGRVLPRRITRFCARCGMAV